MSAVFQRRKGAGQPTAWLAVASTIVPSRSRRRKLASTGLRDPFWVRYPRPDRPRRGRHRRAQLDGLRHGRRRRRDFGTFYTELRYHYIRGPTVQTIGPVQPPSGCPRSARRTGSSSSSRSASASERHVRTTPTSPLPSGSGLFFCPCLGRLAPCATTIGREGQACVARPSRPTP